MIQQAYFSGIEEKILVNLRKANKSIKVAVAWFTNPVLFEAILERVNAGIPIDLILADDKINFINNKIDFQLLVNAGGIIRISRYPKLMHHKFCILDDKILINGSYNWTKSAEFSNLENIVISTENSLVQQFVDGFEKLRLITERVQDCSSIVTHDYFGETARESLFNTAYSPPSTIENLNEPNSIILSHSTQIDNLFEEAQQLYMQARHKPALAILLSIIKIDPNIAKVYDLMACVKWRQNQFAEQVEFANRAIEMDTQMWEAYNLAAIGYSHLGNDAETIRNYNICINKEPNNYVFIRNRGLSYLDLDNDSRISIDRRKQLKFKEKAIIDLERAIVLTNQYEVEHDDYMLYYARGTAKLSLHVNKARLAKGDLMKALNMYNVAPKDQQDVHILREINAALKEISNYI